MNIVVLCPHYFPDVAPTGDVMTSIATQLVARGHRLHVVTSLPWYEHHKVEPGWDQHKVLHHTDLDWGRITRVNPFPTADKANIPARAVSFGGFTAVAGLAAAVLHGDVQAEEALLAGLDPHVARDGLGLDELLEPRGHLALEEGAGGRPESLVVLVEDPALHVVLRAVGCDRPMLLAGSILRST